MDRATFIKLIGAIVASFKLGIDPKTPQITEIHNQKLDSVIVGNRKMDSRISYGPYDTIIKIEASSKMYPGYFCSLDSNGKVKPFEYGGSSKILGTVIHSEGSTVLVRLAHNYGY